MCTYSQVQLNGFTSNYRKLVEKNLLIYHWYTGLTSHKSICFETILLFKVERKPLSYLFNVQVLEKFGLYRESNRWPVPIKLNQYAIVSVTITVIPICFQDNYLMERGKHGPVVLGRFSEICLFWGISLGIFSYFFDTKIVSENYRRRTDDVRHSNL